MFKLSASNNQEELSSALEKNYNQITNIMMDSALDSSNFLIALNLLLGYSE